MWWLLKNKMGKGGEGEFNGNWTRKGVGTRSSKGSLSKADDIPEWVRGKKRGLQNREGPTRTGGRKRWQRYGGKVQSADLWVFKRK